MEWPSPQVSQVALCECAEARQLPDLTKQCISWSYKTNKNNCLRCSGQLLSDSTDAFLHLPDHTHWLTKKRCRNLCEYCLPVIHSCQHSLLHTGFCHPLPPRMPTPERSSLLPHSCFSVGLHFWLREICRHTGCLGHGVI